MRRVLARFAIAAGAAACVILATRPATSFERAVPRGAITAAAAYATAHPQARILADTTSATALLWLDPAVAGRVGFDSRIEIFRPAAAAAWLDFNSATAPDWARVLRGYDVIVASRVAHPVLARRAGRLSGWDVVWSDSSGVVLVRRA
jgi:hypothetical protein